MLIFLTGSTKTAIMEAGKAMVFAQLQRDITSYEGRKKTAGAATLGTLPSVVEQAFPGGKFSLGAVHEFVYSTSEAATATCGFVSAILGCLLRSAGACIWLGTQRAIFPPALKSFGIAPDRIIFIDLQKQKDILWAMEESLKCQGVSAVVGEVDQLSFTASRRLQLAVEQSQVTGFILRKKAGIVNVTACLSRWKITPLPSKLPDNMPGVGFARWHVDLVKVRNGIPGQWQLEFSGGRLRHVAGVSVITVQRRMKTG